MCVSLTDHITERCLPSFHFSSACLAATISRYSISCQPLSVEDNLERSLASAPTERYKTAGGLPPSDRRLSTRVAPHIGGQDKQLEVKVPFNQTTTRYSVTGVCPMSWTGARFSRHSPTSWWFPESCRSLYVSKTQFLQIQLEDKVALEQKTVVCVRCAEREPGFLVTRRTVDSFVRVAYQSLSQRLSLYR